MSARARVSTVLVLASLTVFFYWKLALTNLIMVGVDVFTYFYPYRYAINQALRRGSLPLWDPYLFMGVPLLANAQAGTLYPLNWPFIWLEAPQAINASIVLHVFIAALGCWLFARHVLQLSGLGALVAASVFAFGGYAGSLVEHVNQLQAAAWFPWLLWWAERAVCPKLQDSNPKAGTGMRDRLRASMAGGVVLALQLLAGHAQVTFISLMGVGVWVVVRFLKWDDVVTQLRSFRQSPLSILKKSIGWRSGGRRLASAGLSLALLVALGVGLSAVQLAPMLELSRLSIRGGGMTYREAVAFSLPPNLLLEAFLPTYGLGDSVFSEYVAFVGVAALCLATIGIVWAGRRQLALLALLLMGLALAFGLFDPIYFLLFKLVPGFGLFRVPARWLFLYAFAVSGFAGTAIDAAANRWSFDRLKSLHRRRGMILVAGVTLLVLLTMLRLLVIPPLLAVALWCAASATTLGLYAAPLPPAVRQAALALAVVAELFAATRWLPYNQPTAPEAFSSLRPAIAFLLSEDHTTPWRILSYSDLNWDPGDLDDIRALFNAQLSPEAIYQYTVAAKTKEIVGPNLALRYGLQSVDGYDGGILPLARFVGLQSLFLTPAQINPDGRLRERLRAVPPAKWLGLFDVRYVTADKIFDTWVDGIYYDLGLGLSLDASHRESYDIPVSSDFSAAGIGVVSYLQDAGVLPNDTPIAKLLVSTDAGKTYSFTLRAGRETSESEYERVHPAHDKARVVHTLRDNPAANEYYALLPFTQPARVSGIEVRSLLSSGTFVLHGMTLADPVHGTGKPLSVSGDGQFALVHSGDVKIYRVLQSSGRAIVVHRTTVEPDDSSALRKMQSPDFDPAAQLILDAGQALTGTTPATAALVANYEPERVVVQTNDPAEGYLLLKDSWYPGWRAFVDGQPASIARADTYFRAVFVAAGPHVVEFRYEPDSLRLGAGISVITGLTGAIVGMMAWRGWRSG